MSLQNQPRASPQEHSIRLELVIQRLGFNCFQGSMFNSSSKERACLWHDLSSEVNTKSI